MTSRRHPLYALLVALLVFATVLAPGSAQAREVPGADRYPTVEAAPRALVASEAASYEVIKQGYDLLLDRYVVQLKPAELLNAGYVGVARGLAEAGVTVKSPGPIQLDGSREGAWSGFQAQLGKLLQESPPPDGFSPTAVAVAAMARSVDEGHTAYMTVKQYQEFLQYLSGEFHYGGIGLRPRRPGVTIAEVFPDSPAAQAGLAVGDSIVAVDGEPTAGKSLEEVALLIRGPAGTAVRLDVERPGSSRLNFEIVRAMIKVEYIDTSVIQDDLAYIRLRGFPDRSVADRFEQFLDRLPELNVRGLIIDLRGNGGGRIDYGTRLLNRFISSGPLFSQVDRSGQRRVESARGPGWSHPIPVAILIDEATASMGEIFASAMRERGSAWLVGKRTSGNVAGAQVFPLSDGSAVQVTIMEIYSGNGELLNRVGVEPDFVLEATPEQIDAGRDVQLEAAVIHIWEELAKAPAPAGR